MTDLQHVQIRKDLFLVQHTRVKAKKAAAAVPAPRNWILLFDRSGSMWGVLDGLVQDIKALARTMNPGDTVSLGWFSGYGEHNFIVKGFKISGDADYAALDKMLDRHAQTVGLTCFSEILADTKQVVEDLSVFSNSYSLIFFSDGYPTVGGNREIETVLKTMEELRADVTTALLVGYGNYYNKQLMTDMSEKLGAALTHSENLKEFRVAADCFLKDSKGAGKRVKIELDDVPYAKGASKYAAAFSVTGETVTLLAQDEGNVVYAAETDAAVDRVYVLSSVRPKGSEEVSLSEKDVRSGASGHESLVQGLYAAAYVLCQTGKTDQAMEALATVGDAYLIDALTNAYTPAEYGVAEKKVVRALAESAGRYVKGYKKNYLPPADAFCLLDVLDVLLDDPQAAFYPYSKSFDYKRIGVKAEVSDPNTPKFRAEDNARVPISSLVWNSSMLNLSVAAKIHGKIGLVGDASKHGFSQEYPTWVHRNYALVKDGFLNVKVLPVSLSEGSFNELQAHGVIDDGETFGGESAIYDLHLDRVPVINRAMAEGRTSATALAKLVASEYELKGKLKALKYFKDELVGDETEKVGVFAALNDAQIAFLEANFIGKNGFSPKVEKGEATDFYYAKEFDIKVKGLSSFPKVADVQKKVKDGKKLTVSDTYVNAGIQEWEKSGMAKQKKEVALAWLTGRIADLLKDQRAISRQIQEVKFAVLLAKKWFDEFQTREENTLSLGDLTFTFALREVKVDF